MCTPLWIIGLDGLDPDLVLRWVTSGELPTLASCMERGVFGTLRSTCNELTTSAWTTVATGANPGAHGIYNFQERVPGEYRLYLPNSTYRGLPAFWDVAGDDQRRVILARVPMTFPLQPLNGLAVADWLAPSPATAGFTYPEQLGPELVRRFGHALWGDPVGDHMMRGFRDHRRFLRRLIARVDQTFDLFQHLLSMQDTDLLFGYVQDTDVAGHILWRHHDAGSPLHRPDTPPDLRDALLSVYQRVDRDLGRLLERREFDGNLMIVSDHGMGANTLGPHCVAPLLEAAGLMVCHQNGDRSPGVLRRLRQAVSRRIPWHIRRRIKPIDGDTRSRGFTELWLSHIDFSRSRAFSYFQLQVGEIWLNLRGRDRDGIVEPGAEAEELIADITRLFLEARDPETGCCPVEEVRRREELFAGEYTRTMPDLLVRFREGVQVHGLSATLDDGSQIAVRPPPDGADASSAHHRLHGTLIACGPDIVAGDRPLCADLMDVAPTALALLDTAIPSHIEGAVLEAMLGDTVRSRIADSAPPRRGRGAPLAYAPGELGLVARRLRGLGYM
ncbi:MAG: alkaline phosphatase family protein [Armatimonadota bacterium]|jgi:predicted AlkP superfamily phosphohydrolase/phosphomutase